MDRLEEKITREKPRRKWLLKPAQTIVLGFLAAILLGTLMLALPISNKNGNWLGFLSAMFTSTSAVCVTGLIVVPTATTFSAFGQVILLLLIQIGGLGLMTLSSLFMVLLKRKLSLKDRLALQEALNRDEMTGVVRLVQHIVIMTLVVEAAGALLMLPVFVINNGGIGVWQAVFTSVSAFCNAGFDIMGTLSAPYISFTGYVNNVVISLTLMMLIFLGGIGFTVISDVLKNRFRLRKLHVHSKIVLLTSAILIVSGFIYFICAEQSYSLAGLSGGGKTLAALFQSVTSRTAGFNTIDIDSMHPASRLVTIMLMFVGASPGSTGGGIKTTTIALVICMLISGLRGRDDIVIMKRSIKPKNAFKAVAVVVLGIALVLLSTLILSFTEMSTLTEAGMYSFDKLLFESVSAFGTVGLSTGITPFLSTGGRIVLMITMFFGRVGPITIGLIFVSKNSAELLKYPESSIAIG